MIGRQAELDQIAAALGDAVRGNGRIVGVRAEPGMGKSRLLAEAVALAETDGVAAARGEAQPFGTRASYFAWSELWRSLLDVPDTTAEEQYDFLITRVHLAAPRLVERVPLLGVLLGVDLPDSPLTARFDAKLRKTSLESLICELLAVVVRERGPLVLLLEDCHWLDPLSRDLLDVVARSIADLPVLVLLAYRPDDGPQGQWLRHLDDLPHFRGIALAELDDASAHQMIDEQTRRLFGTDAVGTLVGLVSARSGGNPLHIQELLTFVAAHDVDPNDAAALAALEIPETLHALVLGRIDTLAERVRRTVKVASVLGRLFDLRTLRGAYPVLGSADDVLADLMVLQTHELVLPEDPEAGSFLFRHALLRDVAYDSLPFAMRETLHTRAAEWIEDDPNWATTGRRRLDLLAHHYGHTRDDLKKRRYLVLAADAAAQDYANAVACEYYERARELGTEMEREEVLAKLGNVLELVGDWPGAARNLDAALDSARRRGDRTATGHALSALAEVARKQGRYRDAEGLLGEAAELARAAGDDAVLGRALHLQGTLASQQGRTDEARERYEASLVIRRRRNDRLGEASLLSNLAIVLEQHGDYPAARRVNTEALDLLERVGDRRAVAMSRNNLGNLTALMGDLSDARSHFAEALRSTREIGDRWLEALIRHGLANTERDLGMFSDAGPSYGAALDALRSFDDRWSLSLLLEDVARLAVKVERPADALTLLGAADACREAIGAPRSQSETAELQGAVDAASAAVADARSLRDAGTALSDDEVAAVVKRICSFA